LENKISCDRRFRQVGINWSVSKDTSDNNVVDVLNRVGKQYSLSIIMISKQRVARNALKQ